MEDLNPTTPNSKENIMPAHMIKYIFESFITDGGEPKVTEFKRHLDALIKSEIKPLCIRSGKSADGTGWRSELKARFSGRGAKWVIVALSEINPTISSFESQGIDCSSYKTLVEMNGGAWIRFSGARIDNGQQLAAFEVRTEGSTQDHPKQLHLIPVADLDEVVRPLGGTPRSLGLETEAKPAAVEPEVEAAPAVETEAELETTVEPEADEVEAEEVEAVEAEAFDIDAVEEPELETDEALFESFDELYEDDDDNAEI